MSRTITPDALREGTVYGLDPDAFHARAFVDHVPYPTRVRCVNRFLEPEATGLFESVDGQRPGELAHIPLHLVRILDEPAPEALPVSEFTARRVIGWVADRLLETKRGGVTEFAWDGHTLALGVERHPGSTMRDAPASDVVVIAVTSDPKLTPDGLLVWPATATVDDKTTVPVRVTWRPERTEAAL